MGNSSDSSKAKSTAVTIGHVYHTVDPCEKSHEYSYSVHTVDKHLCAFFYNLSRLYTDKHTGCWGACKPHRQPNMYTTHQSPQNTKHAGMKHNKIWRNREEIYG